MHRSRSRTGPAARAARLVLPWRSPLARGADRLRGLLLLLLLLLAVAPLVLLDPVEDALEQRLVVTAQEQVAGRQKVTATLRDGAPLPVAQGGDTTSGLLAPTVLAEWTGPDGRPSVAVVEVRPGARAGDPVSVWVDGAGTAVSAPQPDLLANRAWAQALLAALSWWCALAAAHLLAGLLFERHDDRWWTQQWARTGPRWTSRR